MTVPDRGAAGSGTVLLQAALALARERDEDAILGRIVDAAVDIARARYAALAVYEQGGVSARFIHRGMSPDVVRRIGHPPSGRGLLAAVTGADEPIRVDNVAADPRYRGLPPGHPPLGGFLGVAVRSGGRTHGNLYVGQGEGEGGFDSVDEQALATLAALAACAIDGARLVVAERERGSALAASAAAQERERLRAQALAQVIAAQEDERARVARDLHDEIGQALTGVLLGLHLVDTAVRADPIDAARAAARTADVRALVADALQQVRRLAADLRPTVLDDLGLTAALHRLVGDVSERLGFQIVLDVSDLHCEDRADDHPESQACGRRSDRLPTAVETVAYRVVQESLTNIVRHARADHVEVCVRVSNGGLRAEVTDDGTGFDPVANSGSLGLRGMAERADLAGGRLHLRSSPGVGTTVQLWLPLGDRS